MFLTDKIVNNIEIIDKTHFKEVIDVGVELHIKEGTVVAYISGEIDHHSAKGIRQEIDEACLRTSPEILVLDFGDVTFMDSSGVGLVMGRFKLLQDLEGRVILANLPPYIKKMMKLAGLEQLVDIGKDCKNE